MSDRGLYRKYRIINKDNGRTVNDESFVLRPERDPIARTALLAYALATPNRKLAADLDRWMEKLDEPREDSDV